jgi:hypothetical protein
MDIGVASGIYGRQYRCIEDLGKRLLDKLGREWEENIKTYLQEVK